ncbi:Spy/CpxP family protein refolding chaperone [Acidisoma sp. C75]
MPFRSPRRRPAPRASICLALLALTPLLAFGPTRPAAAQSAAGSVAPATAVPAAAVPAPGAAAGHHPGSKALNNYLAQLHGSLRITAAEEPLWASFAQIMRDNAYTLGQAYRERRAKLRSMTAIEDLNSYVGVEQTRLDGLKRTSAAFAALYAQMPPDQQKVADALFLEDLPGGPHRKAHPGGAPHHKKKHDAAASSGQ